MTVDWFYWNVYVSILYLTNFFVFFFVADGQIWFSIRTNISSIRPCPASLSDWHKIRVVTNVSLNLFIFHTEGLLKGFFYFSPPVFATNISDVESCLLTKFNAGEYVDLIIWKLLHFIFSKSIFCVYCFIRYGVELVVNIITVWNDCQHRDLTFTKLLPDN